MGNVILGLLLFAPQTLYSLTKQFEQTISLFYSASLGGVRSALLALESRGLVVFEEQTVGGRHRKLYSINDAGRAEFFSWLTDLPAGGDLEVAALSRLFFLGLLPDAASRSAVLVSIRDRIEQDESALARMDEHVAQVVVPDDYRQVLHYQRKTLGYGLAAHATSREFFDRLIAEES